MNDSGNRNITPSVADADGVRVIRQPRPIRRSRLLYPLLALAAIGAGVGCLILIAQTQQPDVATLATDAGNAAPADLVSDLVRTATKRTAVDILPGARRAPIEMAPPEPNDPVDWPSGDPNDIATHLLPSDPVPTMTELIDALHARGDHTGIGAFNPPGTSPLLQGLLVPDDFVLPPGYVRHHQVTDDGEPLAPILMFSPDVEFRDPSGRVIPIPEDRVVPPELAPPGLPIRQSDIPPR